VIPRAASALFIVYSLVVIQRAMPWLPERIPTRFDIHGHPASVSRPESLWLFLAAQALMVGLFLAIPYLARRAPHLVSLGSKRLSDFVPHVRDQILGIIDGACGWLAAGSALFMTILIRQIIRAAMEPRPGPSIWLIVVFLIAFAAVLGFHVWRYAQLERNSRPASPLQGNLNKTPRDPRSPASKR
jgi:uncharacterized membrane protein